MASSFAFAWSLGSSPLTRGKLSEEMGRAPHRGLIPAHAGKTLPSCSTRSHWRAHPRSRGENCARSSSLLSRLGSSPLTRGKPGVGDNRRNVDGLIPAHAGKTARPGEYGHGAEAHPRSRGENAQGHILTRSFEGSSPLTRGKLERLGGDGLGGGLIPAHAGKTRGRSPRPRPWRAHPRSRGENMQAAMQLTRDNGSSPLTRGKPCLVRNRSPLGGLIPAHAGKTLLMPAHMPSMKGSSPLTRGKPSGQAGPAPPTPAHPRSRGENAPLRQ